MLLICVFIAGCTGTASDERSVTYPDTPAGAAQLAEDFLRQQANPPTSSPGFVRPTGTTPRPSPLTHSWPRYGGYWQAPRVLGPNSRPTQFTVEMATTEELAAGSGSSTSFPGLYRSVAPHVAPGQTVYQIVFREPGSSLGTAVDGLIHTDGAWRIFPTPWAVLSVDEPGHQH